ncbi:unnamed protein product [Tuber melanosporum]|uniref:(Perigord truffle) hypothetical protein n=1 Tax=Tuber melanosporum (strain Mel28) TaxID=656061 RepID=D5GMM7_TUBMM|nr:uncharacterized protein GSTUM_00010816001 [Tuber melanosporum]CAZ85770.1 unnamed protein product [Tuber melanosporum]
MKGKSEEECPFSEGGTDRALWYLEQGRIKWQLLSGRLVDILLAGILVEIFFFSFSPLLHHLCVCGPLGSFPHFHFYLPEAIYSLPSSLFPTHIRPRIQQVRRRVPADNLIVSSRRILTRKRRNRQLFWELDLSIWRSDPSKLGKRSQRRASGLCLVVIVCQIVVDCIAGLGYFSLLPLEPSSLYLCCR